MKMTKNYLLALNFNVLIILTIACASVFAARNPAGSIAVLSSGDMIVPVYATAHLTIRKYRADGTIASSFGSGGTATTRIGTSNSSAKAIVIQPDGKILVAGFGSESGMGAAVVLVRYNPSGSLDTSFGSGDGIVIKGVVGSRFFVSAIALQPDGKIVVAGYKLEGDDPHLMAFRFNSDGEVDTSFGFFGLVYPTIPGRSAAYSAIVQTDGKILISGYSGEGFGTNFLIVRLNANGTLDTSFSGDGKVINPFSDGRGMATSIALLTNFKIMATRLSGSPSSSTPSVLSRFNVNGNLDTTYSPDLDGWVSLRDSCCPTSIHQAWKTAVDRDDKVLAASVVYRADGEQFVDVSRLTSSGTFDPTFGVGGRVSDSMGYLPGSSTVDGLVARPDGKIVVFARVNGVPTIIRYNASGTRDTTFSGDGLMTFAG